MSKKKLKKKQSLKDIHDWWNYGINLHTGMPAVTTTSIVMVYDVMIERNAIKRR